MKIPHRANFAQKLTMYLLAMFWLIFCIIFVCLFTTSQNFLHKNTFDQVDRIASNLIRIFDHKISEIEGIPAKIFNYMKPPDAFDPASFTSQVLISFPVLSDYYLVYDSLTYCSYYPYTQTLRQSPETLSFRKNSSLFFPADTAHLFRQTSKNGYWTFLNKENNSMRACYCEPVFNYRKDIRATLELHLDLQKITDFFYDVTLFHSGYPFLIDNRGNFILHPDPEVFKYRNVSEYIRQAHISCGSVLQKFLKGGKGIEKIFKGKAKYYFYYTPVPASRLRLGIICPYGEILTSSNRFYLFMYLIFGAGLLVTAWFVIRIVYRQSAPLQLFISKLRPLAEGKEIELPAVPPQGEIRELHDVFQHMQTNLLTYSRELKKTVEEKEKIITEIKLARKIQSRFLPKEIELPPNVELRGDLQQCKSVGGDLYEYFRIGDLLYFAIGDVSGKGVPAALYMASVIKLFRYVASRQTSTAEISNIINNYMCDNANDDMYITMFIGIMDLHSGLIRFTNAGHPEPIIIHENRQISYLNKYPDIPIGILDDYQYNEHTYTLRKNCQILLFTDGITDAENEQGQFYGKQRLIKCIQSVTENTPREIVKTLLGQLRLHIGKADQSDDFTILSILYKRMG